MKEKEVSTTDEVLYKNSIWDDREELHRLLAHATKVLAQKTSLLSVTTTSNGDLYYAGVGNLLGLQEFFDLQLSRTLFERLDELNYWSKLLEKMTTDEDVYFLLGEEDFADPAFDRCASIFGDFQGKNVRGMIGVIGPKRMTYEILAPQIKYFSGLIEEILSAHKSAA